MAKTKTKEQVEATTSEAVETTVVKTAVAETIETKEEEKATAKAGKRSAKAAAEAEEKATKEERKAVGDTTPQSDEAKANDKRGPAPKTRSRLERRGKNYRKLAGQVEVGKLYSLDDAIALAAHTSPVKFDATIELHINLNVDPRQADQNIRATVTLPHGTGKTVRVAVFAPADQLEKAKKAGADVAGEDDFLAQLDKEQLDFDILIATPQMMPKLGKYARLLGPRGLMPNPKSGTVTTNIAKAVEEAKAGRVEYRVDKQAIVHQGIGKVSFGAAKLSENAKTFIASLGSVKPTSIKGAYIKSVAVSSTMGPGVKVDVTSL
jgi:large subunit ribosomal protein L1